jgi:predicted phosphoribosyltransferase
LIEEEGKRLGYGNLDERYEKVRERKRLGDKRINREEEREREREAFYSRERSIQIRIRRGHRTGLRSDMAAQRERERESACVCVLVLVPMLLFLL